MRSPFLSWPISRILSRTAIHLPRLREAGRSPAAYLGLGEQRRRPCLALHRVGFAWPACRHAAGALLPHHFTLAGSGLTCCPVLRRCVSVALSRGFPRVGFPDHPCPAVSGLSSRAGCLPGLPRLLGQQPSMVGPEHARDHSPCRKNPE